jgi:hypothetical protein
MYYIITAEETRFIKTLLKPPSTTLTSNNALIITLDMGIHPLHPKKIILHRRVVRPLFSHFHHPPRAPFQILFFEFGVL